MFGMLTQFDYSSEEQVIIGEFLGDDVWRDVFVYKRSMLCAYYNWRGDYMIVRYICGKIDLSMYREWQRFDHELLPASWYFTRIL